MCGRGILDVSGVDAGLTARSCVPLLYGWPLMQNGKKIVSIFFPLFNRNLLGVKAP
jgi:hypothetical protein